MLFLARGLEPQAFCSENLETWNPGTVSHCHQVASCENNALLPGPLAIATWFNIVQRALGEMDRVGLELGKSMRLEEREVRPLASISLRPMLGKHG